ncbi:MAG: hypothetical protein EWM72_03388 [Nitrospira sp.]|nr:MAG: hypothetical protein EWM72_03388 [Nitrospira sp.]
MGADVRKNIRHLQQRLFFPSIRRDDVRSNVEHLARWRIHIAEAPIAAVSLVPLVAQEADLGRVCRNEDLALARSWPFASICSNREACLHQQADDALRFTRQYPRWVCGVNQWVAVRQSCPRETARDRNVLQLPNQSRYEGIHGRLIKVVDTVLLTGVGVVENTAVDRRSRRNSVLTAYGCQDAVGMLEILTMENRERKNKDSAKTAFVTVNAEPRIWIPANRNDVTHVVAFCAG